MQLVQRYSLVSAITGKHRQQGRSFTQERRTAFNICQESVLCFSEIPPHCFYSTHLKKEQCTVMFIYVPRCYKQPSPAMNCRLLTTRHSAGHHRLTPPRRVGLHGFYLCNMQREAVRTWWHKVATLREPWHYSRRTKIASVPFTASPEYRNCHTRYGGGCWLPTAINLHYSGNTVKGT